MHCASKRSRHRHRAHEALRQRLGLDRITVVKRDRTMYRTMSITCGTARHTPFRSSKPSRF